ncbi:MAG: hypothetical protein A2W00_03935 [Candidatus Eisenbacteria bacterium RBG_16_71_46]|nr:MAG: hypothetical protein A2W00_03935 [Candidatus Eisenbacteria bacterium RBG_16_71_46]
MRFRNRQEAGRALAERLTPLLRPPCIVLALPRGGAVVGLPVARALEAPLALASARKLTAPRAPELAFGAVDEDGATELDYQTIEQLGLTRGEVRQIRAQVLSAIRGRRARCGGSVPLGRFPESVVVLVDDGIATGLSMCAAVRYARRHRAREVVVAAPVSASDSVKCFRVHCDLFVSLVVDPDLVAVGQYYDDFHPVDDAEVADLLALAREEHEALLHPPARASNGA